MHALKIQKTINHSPDKVWSSLNNFSDIWMFHPLVANSSSLNDQSCGLGAERQCTLYNGGQLKERVSAHDAENRTLTVEVTDHGPFPLTHMELTMSVEPDGAGSRVLLEGGFVPKYGPIGWVMGTLMMKPQFEKLLGQLIDGLDTHLSTGRIIEKGGKVGEPLKTAAAA